MRPMADASATPRAWVGLCVAALFAGEWGDYRLLAPLMLAAAIGYGLARPFQPGSAYAFAFPGLGIRLYPGRFSILKVAS
jgi:hypothetical protein